MGRLVRFSEMNEMGDWYSSNTRNNNGRMYSPLPNDEFKIMLAVHHDCFRTNLLKIRIRRFIEEHLRGSVIMDVVDRGYWYKFPNTESWDSNGFSVINYWTRFWFEYESDALMFKIEFSDFISKVQQEHPDGEHPYTDTHRTMDEYGNWVDRY